MDIQSLDFHYHAGQERPLETSLRDHLDHAVLTGRRVLGVTDHLQFYWPGTGDPAPRPYYSRTIEGLRRYREEIDSLKGEFPGLRVLFGPEIPPKMRLAEVPRDVLDLADFFICEQAFHSDDGALEENTGLFVGRLREIGEFVRATGKPTFLAHPFRLSVNHRLVKKRIEPWVTSLERSRDGRFAPEALSRFFLLDVERIAAAAAEHGVPLEINGSTEERVRASNLPAALQMMRAAYRLLRDAGVELVPGSDQHSFTCEFGRMGRYVPYETFEGLGMTADDIGFAAPLWKAGA